MQQDPWAAFSDPVSLPQQAPARPRSTATLDQVFPALVAQESGGRAGVRGPMTPYGQALGRTQMLPATAQEMARKTGEQWRPEMMTGTSPEAAAYQDRLGRAYLEEGYRQTGSVEGALSYYHGGPNRRLWGPRTRDYVSGVMGRVGGEQVPQQPQNDPYAAFSEPVGAGQAQTAGNSLSAEELRALAQGSPATSATPPEVPITGGVQNVGGRAILTNPDGTTEDRGPWDQYWNDQSKRQSERAALAARRSDPAYQAEYARAQGGAENIPDPVAALLAGQTLGGKGIVPYVTGAVSYLDAMGRGVDPNIAAQAGRDATRDTMDTFQRDHPGQNFAYQMAGGLFTPGMKGAGDWVGGATGVERTARAAVVGGGMGAGSGLLNSSGDAGQRLTDTLIGGATGMATGGLLDAGLQRATAGATWAVTASAPRQLSRMGISLTPAQMVAEVPGLGSLARKTEDVAAGYLPFVQGARNRSIEGFDRAITNEALASIGKTLPPGVRGRDSIRAGAGLLNQAYGEAVGSATVVPDAQWTADLTAALAPSNLSRQARRQLSDLTADLRDRFSGPISGNDWKQIDSELSSLIHTAGNEASTRPLGRSLREIRDAFGQALERSSPGSLEKKQNADAAFANFERIRRAAANPTTARNDGMFSTSNLNGVLARSEGRAYAQGEARLQQTTDLAEKVLPPTIGDTGSGQRAIIGGMLLGGAHFSPMAIPVVGVSLAYAKPFQALLNLAYRATDPQAAGPALAELQRFAGRNPALQPYYQAAVQHVRDAFGSQSPEPAPARAGLLSPTGP